MHDMERWLFWGVVKLGLITSGVFYGFLLLATYAKEGPDYRPNLELADPVRSVERLLIWAGIKVATAISRAARSTLDLLYEASADVGTWVVSKSGAQVQARVRSRFL